MPFSFSFLVLVLILVLFLRCVALRCVLTWCVGARALQEKTKEEEDAEGEQAAGGGACGAAGKPLVADKLTHLVVELAAPITLAGRPLRLVAHSLPIVLIVNVSQVRWLLKILVHV